MAEDRTVKDIAALAQEMGLRLTSAQYGDAIDFFGVRDESWSDHVASAERPVGFHSRHEARVGGRRLPGTRATTMAKTVCGIEIAKGLYVSGAIEIEEFERRAGLHLAEDEGLAQVGRLQPGERVLTPRDLTRLQAF